MQVAEATADLGGVELDLLPLQARWAYRVDVEAEVPSVHDGQHHAQGVLGLVGVGQAHLRRSRMNGALRVKDALATTTRAFGSHRDWRVNEDEGPNEDRR